MSEKNTYIVTNIGELLNTESCYAVALTPKDQETFLDARAVAGRDISAIVDKLGGRALTTEQIAAILTGSPEAGGTEEPPAGESAVAELLGQILRLGNDDVWAANVLKSEMLKQHGVRTTVKELDKLVNEQGWTVVGTGSSKRYQRDAKSSEAE